jgi:ABC-type lipoprotein export system ATPase subunit
MPVLEIENLRKSFTTPEGDVHSVIRLERLTLEAGAELAVRGGSGSGKTTLLHLISGLHTPDEGVIRIAGETMTGRSERDRDRLRARRIGYIFQAFHLLHGLTVIENLLVAMRFGEKEDPARARALLERVGLTPRAGYLPSRLSVGQQQRVAVARALANAPALVLADEPTGSLDPERARDALKLIRDVCRENGAALVLVSHDPAILTSFERVLTLEESSGATGASVPR